MVAVGSGVFVAAGASAVRVAMTSTSDGLLGGLEVRGRAGCGRSASPEWQGESGGEQQRSEPSTMAAMTIPLCCMVTGLGVNRARTLNDACSYMIQAMLSLGSLSAAYHKPLARSSVPAPTSPGSSAAHHAGLPLRHREGRAGGASPAKPRQPVSGALTRPGSMGT